jgi:hypothetical protein
MAHPSSCHQVPPLTAGQIAQLKADGFLVLPPGQALDPGQMRACRDELWEELAGLVPRMQRDDPSSWTPFTADEVPPRPADPAYGSSYGGGDPRFKPGGARFNLNCGCDELHLDSFARPLLAVAEQLLGAGRVVRPLGVDAATGRAAGSYYADGLSECTRAIHTGCEPRWPVPNATEAVSFDPSAGCVSTLTGQGCRGFYCALPELPRQKPPPGTPAAAAKRQPLVSASMQPKAVAGGLHSDVGLSFPGRVHLRAVCFVDDCPPGCGGFTLWPRTHGAVWGHLWASVHAANRRPPAVSVTALSPCSHSGGWPSVLGKPVWCMAAVDTRLSSHVRV